MIDIVLESSNFAFLFQKLKSIGLCQIWALMTMIVKQQILPVKTCRLCWTEPQMVLLSTWHLTRYHLTTILVLNGSQHTHFTILRAALWWAAYLMHWAVCTMLALPQHVQVSGKNQWKGSDLLSNRPAWRSKKTWEAAQTIFAWKDDHFLFHKLLSPPFSGVKW